MCHRLRAAMLATALVCLLLAPTAARAAFEECGPAASPVTTDDVACQMLPSAHLGEGSPFSYYVPSACTAADPCPVLYLLHGFGGTYRSMQEQYANVLHPAGTRGETGAPPPAPYVFDYRSISTGFTIWGWRFDVEREPIEFLNLRDVSCDGLTLQGTGVVTVTVPAGCGTGLDGRLTFDVDLGPPFPFDEQANASALPVYGRTIRTVLTPLEA